jgi:hypothetical protein
MKKDTLLYIKKFIDSVQTPEVEFMQLDRMLFRCQQTLRNIKQRFRPGLLINAILILLIVI